MTLACALAVQLLYKVSIVINKLFRTSVRPLLE